MYNKSMRFRTILSWLTFLLLIVIIFLARHELAQAWELLGRVNIWILLIIIPIQIFAYYAAGEIIFSYLKAKKFIQNVKPTELMRMALEMNFVNHVLPSGGVSGISYMSWRLQQHKVSPGKATAAQVVRYFVGFVAQAILIAVAVIFVTLDGNINRWIILFSGGIILFMVAGSLAGIYIISSRSKMEKTARWIARMVNRTVRKLTRGKKRTIVHEPDILDFFEDMHDDYRSLMKDKSVLKKPLIWALVFTITEASLFYVTFLALGHPVNPAPILIAYILASAAGFLVVTPGGTGAYEAIMVAFLSVAGLASGTAIAGVVLARVIILLTTIGLGYAFYHRSLMKYGKDTSGTTSVQR